MLLVAIAAVMGKGIQTVYIAIGLTSWVGLCRVIRGEFIKHKRLVYDFESEFMQVDRESK